MTLIREEDLHDYRDHLLAPSGEEDEQSIPRYSSRAPTAYELGDELDVDLVNAGIVPEEEVFYNRTALMSHLLAQSSRPEGKDPVGLAYRANLSAEIRDF